MRNKIIILVYIPKIEMEFDFFIPINKKIGTIKNAIIGFVNENYNNILNNETLIFCDKTSGNVFKEDLFIKNSGIENGTKIILI